VKPARVQTLIPEAAVETFDVAVLHGLAGLNVIGCDFSLHAPCEEVSRGKFRAVIDAQRLRAATLIHRGVQHASNSLASKANSPTPAARPSTRHSKHVPISSDEPKAAAAESRAVAKIAAAENRLERIAEKDPDAVEQVRQVCLYLRVIAIQAKRKGNHSVAIQALTAELRGRELLEPTGRRVPTRHRPPGSLYTSNLRYHFVQLLSKGDRQPHRSVL
jgi:hypothetical protein